MEMGEGAGGRGYIKDNRSEYKKNPEQLEGRRTDMGVKGANNANRTDCQSDRKKTATRVGQPREKNSAEK